MMQKTHILLALLALAIGLQAQEAADTLQLDRPYQQYLLPQDLTAYVDSTSKMGLAEARRQRFGPVEAPEPLSIAHAYWMRFYLPQDTGTVYEFFNSAFDSVTYFVPRKGQGYSTHHFGAFTDTLAGRVGLRYQFEVGEGVDLAKPVYVRVRNFSKWGVDRSFRQLFIMKYPVGTPVVYDQVRAEELLVFGGFLGALFFVFIYFMAQFGMTRRQVYLLYSLYALMLFLYFANRLEYFRSWLIEINPLWFFYINENTQILSGVFYFAFVRSLLNGPERYPRFDKILKSFLAGFIAFMLFYNLVFFIDRFNPLHHWLMTVFRAANVLLSVLFMAAILRKGPTRLEWIVLAGGLMLLLAAVLPPLLVRMQLSIPFLLVELVIFSLALGYQVRQRDLERLRTKEELIRQLEINAGIQQQMQQKLEEEVGRQTSLAVAKTREAEQAKAQELKTSFQRELEAIKMKALQAQMNPHFLFNCLNSIRLFYLKNETRKADAYITKFSRLLRLMLSHSRANFISLQEELDALQLYVEFEQMRFKQRFDYEFVVGQGVQASNCQVQPLTIQPFVENAIWHGLMQNSRPGRLSVQVEKQGGQLLIVVEDNGIGREKASAMKAGQEQLKAQSFGLRITQERMELMRQSMNQKAAFKIVDLKDESENPTGTRVEIVYDIISPTHESSYN